MNGCLHPITIFIGAEGSDKKKDGSPGKKVEFWHHSCDYSELDMVKSFNPETGEVGSLVTIPCGKCYYCRKKKAYEWLVRIQMETSLYDDDECCFLTLTYDDAHLPWSTPVRDDAIGSPTLNHQHVQAFLKRLRRAIEPKQIRYFMCGEYGTKYERPHYHLCIFGYDFFKDSYFAGVSQSGETLFGNKLIDDAWQQQGFASFGSLDDASAAYVAQYNVKKLVSGLEVTDGRKSPYIMMSRRPGIGHEYIMRHAEDIKRNQGFYFKGKFVPIDRYMFKVLIKEGIMNYSDMYEINQKKADFADLASQFFIDSHSGISVDNLLIYQRSVANDKMKHDREVQLSARGDL